MYRRSWEGQGWCSPNLNAQLRPDLYGPDITRVLSSTVRMYRLANMTLEGRIGVTGWGVTLYTRT
jgi:hypothetical protein